MSPHPQDLCKWSKVVGGRDWHLQWVKCPRSRIQTFTCVLVNIPMETHWIRGMGWGIEESRKGQLGGGRD